MNENSFRSSSSRWDEKRFPSIFVLLFSIFFVVFSIFFSSFFTNISRYLCEFFARRCVDDTASEKAMETFKWEWASCLCFGNQNFAICKLQARDHFSRLLFYDSTFRFAFIFSLFFLKGFHVSFKFFMVGQVASFRQQCKGQFLRNILKGAFVWSSTGVVNHHSSIFYFPQNGFYKRYDQKFASGGNLHLKCKRCVSNLHMISTSILSFRLF